MGELVDLQAVRSARRPAPRPSGARRPPATFFFDLASPWTYLAAERVDRLLPGVHWRPVAGEALLRGPVAPAAERAAAERRAAVLRLPLVWPEAPGAAVAAMRVAALAQERGQAAAFVLAASRLAFCGGFDLDDVETLAEAAAAAALPLDACLAAARDASRDGVMEADARRLLAGGADRLPVVQVGRALFGGEDRLPEAAAVARGAGARRRAL